jgi:FKBP-type peptidyl-prolyl cis-trans isomerase (trigger factor)
MTIDKLEKAKELSRKIEELEKEQKMIAASFNTNDNDRMGLRIRHDLNQNNSILIPKDLKNVVKVLLDNAVSTKLEKLRNEFEQL